jgi:hypothetical protein
MRYEATTANLNIKIEEGKEHLYRVGRLLSNTLM